MIFLKSFLRYLDGNYDNLFYPQLSSKNNVDSTIFFIPDLMSDLSAGSTVPYCFTIDAQFGKHLRFLGGGGAFFLFEGVIFKSISDLHKYLYDVMCV